MKIRIVWEAVMEFSQVLSIQKRTANASQNEKREGQTAWILMYTEDKMAEKSA